MVCIALVQVTGCAATKKETPCDAAWISQDDPQSLRDLQEMPLPEFQEPEQSIALADFYEDIEHPAESRRYLADTRRYPDERRRDPGVVRAQYMQEIDSDAPIQRYPAERYLGERYPNERYPAESYPTDRYTDERLLAPNDLSPMLSGTRLGGRNVTATEHALRLQEEKQKLESANRLLQSQIDRMQNRAKESDELLREMTTKMTAASLELDKAKAENEKLNSEISKLRQAQLRAKLDTTRLLESIQAELDDVLMREISIGNGS